MPGVTVDGNDLPLVAATVKEAIVRAKAGEGPALIECKTYRIKGHSKSDRNLYRTKEEIEDWKARCPIRVLQKELLAHERFSEAALSAIEETASATINEALEFARTSPDPRVEDLTRNVYAEK